MRQQAQTGTLGQLRGQSSKVIPYALLAIAFVLIAFYGTGVYNFFIPTVVQNRDFSLGVSTLAVIGGVAAFLSPCAFGMLPAYFAFFLSVDSVAGEPERNLRKALQYGLAASLGMVTVAVGLALLILILGATFAPALRVVTPIPNPYTRSLRILAGVFLVTLGILQWRGRSIGLGLSNLTGTFQERTHRLSRRARLPLLSFYLYGILYVLAAVPCVSNVMGAPLLAAFATRGIGAAVSTLFLFLLTMAVLMVVVSIFIGLANQTVLAGLRSSVPVVLRVTSVTMTAMGIALIYLDFNLATFRNLFFHFPVR